MIPEFDENGQLPPGIHRATWSEFVERYATTNHRRKLLEGMERLIEHLKSIECTALYVNGSFVTSKERPNDYDACWNVRGVKFELIDPVLLGADDDGKQAMLEKYGGDIRPDQFSPVELDGTYLDFFRIDRDGNPKGIVELSLVEIEP